MRELTDSERNSFSGNVTRVAVPGPRQLYRLWGAYIEGGPETGSAKAKKNEPLGVWWFDSMFFWNILDNVTEHAGKTDVNRVIKRLIREAAAVSFDWNSFASIYVLTIPNGQSVNAWSGVTKEQPFFSSKAMQGENEAGNVLSGGLVQFFIPDIKNHEGWVSKSPGPFWISPGGTA